MTKNKESSAKIPLKNFILFSIMLSVLGIFFIFLLQANLPPEVPLFYGLPEGEEQLTSSARLVIPLTLSIFITIINFIIILFLRNSFLQKTLVLVSFAISILSFLTTLRIVLLVGSF